MNGLFDTHAHLNDEKFDEDRESVILSLKENGISYVVIPSDTFKSSLKTVEIVGKYDFLYGAVGIHPHEVKDTSDEELEKLKEIAGTNDKIVAIGEIGLDYYYDFSPREIQKELFIKQLNIARDLKLPVIIHSRDAMGDTYDILSKFKGEVVGVMHCYSGSFDMAKRFIDLGYYISLGGPVTFKNAKTPKEVAKNVDLERLLIETDSPYLAPEPVRGKRNEPKNVNYVAEMIASLRGMTKEEIIDVTYMNALKLFNIEV